MNLPRKKSGDPVAAEDWNRVLDMLEQALVMPGRGYRVRRSKQGTVLAIQPGESGGGAGGSSGRFTVTKGTGEGEGHFVKISEGLVYEQNITAKEGDPPVDKPVKVHVPIVGAGLIDDDPAPTLAVADGQVVYLKVTTDAKGLIGAVSVVVDAADMVSTHHEPPNPLSLSGIEGTYYFELAEIAIASGKLTITQVWESDLIWRPTSIHKKAEGGAGVEMIKGFTDGEWEHKWVNGLIEDEAEDPAPAWNAQLSAYQMGGDGLGVLATDGGDSADLKTAGAVCAVKFKYVDKFETGPSETRTAAQLKVRDGLIEEYVPGTVNTADQEFIEIPRGGATYYAGNGVIITDDETGNPARANVVRLYESPDADGLDTTSPTNGGLRGDEESLGFYQVDMCVNGSAGTSRVYMTKPVANSAGTPQPPSGTTDGDAGESLPPA